MGADSPNGHGQIQLHAVARGPLASDPAVSLDELAHVGRLPVDLERGLRLVLVR